MPLEVISCCMVCQAETGEPCFSTSSHLVNERGIYEHVCPNGNFTAGILQEQKFELLLASSIIDLCNESYDSAVQRSSTALERFFEFCINVIYSEFRSDFDSLAKVWKPMSRLSERQIGAVDIAMLLSGAKGPEWPRLENREKLSKLRNDVVHGGYYPTRAEALSHCSRIIDYIGSTLEHAKSHRQEHVSVAVFQHISKLHLLAQRACEGSGRKSRVSTIGSALPISITSEYDPTKSIQDRLAEARELVDFPKRFPRA